MADIIVEKHLIASQSNEPPAGAVMSTETAPGFVELIVWGDGIRIRVRMPGPEAVNHGASIILAAGQAMRVAAGEVKPDAPRILVNGVGGRS
jgi:hypothetical protein